MLDLAFKKDNRKSLDINKNSYLNILKLSPLLGALKGLEYTIIDHRKPSIHPSLSH